MCIPSSRYFDNMDFPLTFLLLTRICCSVSGVACRLRRLYIAPRTFRSPFGARDRNLCRNGPDAEQTSKVLRRWKYREGSEGGRRWGQRKGETEDEVDEAAKEPSVRDDRAAQGKPYVPWKLIFLILFYSFSLPASGTRKSAWAKAGPTGKLTPDVYRRFFSLAARLF